MDLAEFVESTLLAVLQGISAAQAKEGGTNIAAGLKAAEKGLLFHDKDGGTFTAIDFDVAVVADSKGGAKGGLKVWGVGVEANGEHSRQQSSRVKFTVPVRLPEGDQARLAEAAAKRADEQQKLNERMREVSAQLHKTVV